MTSQEIRSNFSQNLIKLRKANNLTQLALAEKLNYSDKAVSKWEVGSVLPDVETMTHIAEFFGTTVNDLIYPPKNKFKKIFYHNNIVTTLILFACSWFLATIIYFILENTTSLNRVWLTFIITLPLSMIILTVCSKLWFKKIVFTLSLSGLMWTTILAIYLIINNLSLWFIFIIGVVGQVIIFFGSQLIKIVIPKKRK